MIAFRHLRLYRLPADYLASLTPQRLDAALGAAPLPPALDGVEMGADGFLPLESLGGGYTFEHNRRVLFRFSRDRRLLPGQVMRRAMDERIDAIRVTEGRTPGGRERRRIRDEVFFELAPRAFVLRSDTYAILDFATGWLCIDTNSRAVADGLCAALREALGSFPALPATTDASVRALFTSWLTAGASPHDSRLVLGTRCILAEPTEGGARIVARDQELFSEEVEAHLAAGKQCIKLALSLDGLVEFTLDEELTVSILRWDEPPQIDGDDASPEGTAILHMAHLSQLVGLLATELELEESL